MRNTACGVAGSWNMRPSHYSLPELNLWPEIRLVPKPAELQENFLCLCVGGATSRIGKRVGVSVRRAHGVALMSQSQSQSLRPRLVSLRALVRANFVTAERQLEAS